MIVGVGVIEIHVHDSDSLKANLGAVRSISGRLRNRFNVSVGEVGGQGTWQRATIGLCMAGSDEGTLRKALTQAVDAVERMHLAEVISSEINLIRLPLSLDWEEGGLPDGIGENMPWEQNLEAEEVRVPLPVQAPQDED